MNIDDVVKLITAITGFLSAIAWPAVTVAVLFYFRTRIMSLLEASELKFKGFGVEATVIGRRTEFALAISAAEENRALIEHGEPTPVKEDNTGRIAALVERAVTPSNIRRLSGARILWVDDNPSWIKFERQALEVLGIDVVIVKSTHEALSKIKSEQYSAIISDLRRGSDKTAGIGLLNELRSRGIKVPFIIYTSSVSTELRDNALAQGAFDAIDRPQDLFDVVLRALISA